jgi:hypothetical protein
MKKIIPFRIAGNVLLAALGLLVIFDILVILGIVPPDIVWGGQLQAAGSNVVVFELVALVVTLFFLLIVAAKMGYVGGGKFKRAVNIGVWVIFAYMILNTVGNLASGVAAENLIFAPLTIVMALLALRLAVE